jgi:hypothetical protein
MKNIKNKMYNNGQLNLISNDSFCIEDLFNGLSSIEYSEKQQKIQNKRNKKDEQYSKGIKKRRFSFSIYNNQ